MKKTVQTVFLCGAALFLFLLSACAPIQRYDDSGYWEPKR